MQKSEWLTRSWLPLVIYGYTTNPTERSTEAIELSTNESGLEWSVESHRALAEQWPSKSVQRLASARLALGGIIQVERSVGLVV